MIKPLSLEGFIMQVKKILGEVRVNGRTHSIAKLENGRFAVGTLTIGQAIKPAQQFDTVDSAFDHWYATLPGKPTAQLIS